MTPVQARWPSLAEDIINGSLGDEQFRHCPMCLTGASDGADTLFGKAAMAAGHEVVHFCGPGNVPSDDVQRHQADCVYRLTDELLDCDTVSEAFQLAGSARVLGGVPDQEDDWQLKWRTSKRNYVQVRKAQTVYVVAYRMPPGPFTPKMDVGGGTGWACQWYIDRFSHGGEDKSECNLYLYDDGAPAWSGAYKDEVTHRRWNFWDVERSMWVPLERPPPPPSGLYCGIGSTRLDDEFGVVAINSLFSSSE